MNHTEYFDFTGANSAEDIYGLLDSMSENELGMVREAIKNIHECAQLDICQRYNRWFDHTLLSVLKDFAQATSSLLQIERDTNTIDVLIRNSRGLDITENSKGMYMALLMAVHIFMEADGDDVVLALTFDCHRIVS